MLQLKKKKAILNHFFSLKGEADVSAAKKYQKVLAHVKCGMRWRALAMRIQTSMVGKHFKYILQYTGVCLKNVCATQKFLC